jgi:siroheme decarboxylase
MDALDYKLLVSLKKGLDLTESPFNEIATELKITPMEVIDRLKRLKEEGVIRRFGASIKPNNIGLVANALVAWKVPEHRVREVGEYLSKYREISHCYERKTDAARWQYTLYTVMHAQNRETITRMVNEFSTTLCLESKILYSLRDLKRSLPSQPLKQEVV